MILKSLWTRALIVIVSVALAAPVWVFAQPVSNAGGAGAAAQRFTKPQIDQMLAPIALYPDSLLAQILLASTYPSQVVQADRWVKAHRDWSKSQINTALNNKNWDLSVKALVPFPKVLAMMDRHLGWTTRLGEAFLDQQSEVIASVQSLRHRAYAQGNLRTTPQQKVVVASNDIEIEPTNPEIIYVPYYNPWDVYGSWWWPGYPPCDFFPYEGPFISFGLYGFAASVGVGPFWNWGWGYWNWGGRDVYVNDNRTMNINNPHARFPRRNFRTNDFHRFGRFAASGLGGAHGRFVHGIGAGFTHRPSMATVRRGLSRPGVGAAHGFAAAGHGFAANKGRVFSHGPVATSPQGRRFAGGAQNHAFGGAKSFGGRNFAANTAGGGPAVIEHGFAGSSTGRVAPAFGGHGFSGGFRGPVGGAPHFGGMAGFGGGAPHFGGGGFGGGAPHFGGGGFGGGAHFGGGGGHFNGRF